MMMESGRQDSIAFGDYSYRMNENYGKISNDYSVLEKEKKQSLPSSSSPRAGFITHLISRFDTLSGIAIKYDVEVADIKKMNGLVTDRQMFALKSLRIPLTGRHPPSPCSTNGSDTLRQSSTNITPAHHLPPELFQSLRLKTSPRRLSSTMSSLQGYYGLEATEKKNRYEGFEMAVYRKGEAHHLEDGPFLKPSSASNPPWELPWKFRSITNGFNDEIADIMSAVEAKDGGPDQANEKLVRRRQKSEADLTARTPERLLKEDSTNGGGYSTIIAKGLALRTKAVNRTKSGAGAEFAGFNPMPTGLGDGFVVAGFSQVRKSLSTSSWQDQDHSSSSLSSVWPAASKWSLKPDLQGVSTVGDTIAIFDGLPKPMSARKSKAALD
ncbi:hypothetical protein ES288_A12G154400v1 [Gossypium darwinii]|uniref:LysM domain-containing protein n=1 Tax=Gossypium darwinii TaxID=34276 RepID=A0A5D2E9V2_GOSDA|nr:hypothetical protein ES288_A12G154400v1 [Gossypium darwinii]